ncbi:heptaprenyl diphosphate synthase component 1 [Gracilibacillus sp. S3-1-1]|uniref:Heptaprenyl diphosphate synthase component 1 n=1 Tax=Gracilibacillus pellucidus TaxID=3095368 RepID=A0ACC6M563_9BACI|nr:heptaprenyl diphosphate synthase component 1 [Gracilibacillus sp. S3-1-1]MDX8046116.1 heptaprenyl diphosphate synthase component 1 [Gracilibacillus sp. S3-1-1]
MTYIKTINFYTNLLTQTIKQDFLDERLDEQALDIHKMVALDYLLQGEPDETTLVQTTMLVQLALNTHDKIGFPFSDKKIKKQQLTVLAGDYYSGIYYFLLAKHNNLPFIRVLADGINEMTQRKMDLYYTKYETLNEFLDEFKDIEGKLIEKAGDYAKKSNQLPYVLTWILIKRLEFELVQAYHHEDTFLRKVIMENVETIQNEQEFIQQVQESVVLFKLELDNYTTENNENTLLPKDLDVFQYQTLKEKWNIALEEGLS